MSLEYRLDVRLDKDSVPMQRYIEATGQLYSFFFVGSFAVARLHTRKDRRISVAIRAWIKECASACVKNTYKMHL